MNISLNAQAAGHEEQSRNVAVQLATHHNFEKLQEKINTYNLSCKLVDLHSRIDRPHKVEACKESNRACDAEEPIRNHQHVPEVHQHRNCLGDVQLGVEIKH